MKKTPMQRNLQNSLELKEIKILSYNYTIVRGKNKVKQDIEYLTQKPKKIYTIKNANVKILSKYKFNTISNIYEVSFIDLHNAATNEIFDIYLTSGLKLFIFYSIYKKTETIPLWNGQEVTITHKPQALREEEPLPLNSLAAEEIISITTEFNAGVFIKVKSINKILQPLSKAPTIIITGEQVIG